MTGNTSFENARFILIFFFSEYIRPIYLPTPTLCLPSTSHKESMGHKEMDTTGQLNNSNVTHTGRPRGSDGKESACNAGDLGSVLGWGRHPGGGKGSPLEQVTEESTVEHSSLTQV